MNDKKFLMDILEMEKNMAVNMTYALNEASNDCLYQKLYQMFASISKQAKDIFTLAYDLGYYQLESETKKKINEALNTLNQELNK